MEDIEEESPKRKESIPENRIIDVNITFSGIYNTPPIAADIFKNSSLQQKYRGFEINQQIVYTMHY